MTALQDEFKKMLEGRELKIDLTKMKSEADFISKLYQEDAKRAAISIHDIAVKAFGSESLTDRLGMISSIFLMGCGHALKNKPGKGDN